MKNKIYLGLAAGLIFSLLLGLFFSGSFLLVFVGLLVGSIIAYMDANQNKQTIRKNFPLLGRLRWAAEKMRPPIRQYFIESDLDGRPIPRTFRSLVYQRAKGEKDTVPFGTQVDVYKPGYEWISHSLEAIHLDETEKDLRVQIGAERCSQPYSASVLNIGAMSFGSLSPTAVSALSAGAKIGDFACNTGEGGVSPYHLQPGGDLIWQVGTGYFGCRADDGGFSEEKFKETVAPEEVKMVELKLSQGAKPGHGGILPAEKNTEEIAKIRGVEAHTRVDSPPTHKAFKTPIGLLEFVTKLRDLSGGKPVGIKLCIGQKKQFMAICKAMQETKLLPDFIVIDGGEGGTGAAPLEYSNSVGMPLVEGLTLADDYLRGFGIREQIALGASGKIFSGFHLVRALALGADFAYSSRGMMLALGCIQALECHKNICPTGVATQRPEFYKGLDPKDKGARVARYHEETVDAARDLLSSTGNSNLENLGREDIFKRVSLETVKSYEEIYPPVKDSSFLKEKPPKAYVSLLKQVQSDSF